jgi:hypothetical protein
MSEPTSKPPERGSVWMSVVITVVAMLIAKACVGAMTEKPRRASSHYGSR